MLALASLAVGTCCIPFMIAAVGTAFSSQVVQYTCFGMGFCCGAQHPTMSGLTRKWRLPTETNWFASLDPLAAVTGSLANCLVISHLTQVLGWRNAMFVCSALTWLVLVGVALFLSEAPTATGGLLPLGKEEAALYRAEGMLTENDDHTPSLPIQRRTLRSGRNGRTTALFLNVGTSGLILSHAMYNAARYTFEQEMPKFYNDMLQEDNAVAGMHLATLHVSAFLIVLFLKERVDGLVNAGTLSLISLRRIAVVSGYMLVAASCGALAFLSVRAATATYVYTLTLNVLWVGLTLQTFGHVANYYDITRTNSGLLMGVGNTIGERT